MPKAKGRSVNGLSDNTRGALLMMLGMVAFTLNDTFMKAVSDELPLFQALFIRGAVTVVALTFLARSMGQLSFRISRRDWMLIGLRTIGEIGAAFYFITALFNMPIANVTAILQALPLTVTLASAVFLREPVGWRRTVAILIGFCGVMLIVRPGTDGFNEYSVDALISVAFVTLRDLSTRRISRSVASMTVAVCAAVGVMLFAAAGLLTIEWQPVTPKAGLQLAGCATFILLGYTMSVMVMRIGDIGFVAPFRYTGLLWALVLGLVIFGDWPSSLTLLGSAIVVATGVFTLYRERRVTRAARRAQIATQS